MNNTTQATSGHIFAFLTCTRVKWEATAEELAGMEGEDVTATTIRQRFSVGWHVDGRTGEITYDDDGSGDYNPTSDTVRLEEPMEENGWIDRRWSPTVLHESRNDVRPEVDFDLSDLTSSDEEAREIAQDAVKEALGWLEGGYNDNGNGTFYAADTKKPFDEPWHYSYALHFVRKHLGANGYIETRWRPVEDGGIAL